MFQVLLPMAPCTQLPTHFLQNIADCSYKQRTSYFFLFHLEHQTQQLSFHILPLESVHQSELESTVFVFDGEIVASKQVELGPINGRFVNITSGLQPRGPHSHLKQRCY